MTPIDENGLRDELWFAVPASAPAPDALGAAVLSRGRAVRRRRVALASAATVAVVALAGVGIVNLLPGTGQTAVPAQTAPASPSVDPTPSPTAVTPSPSATSRPSGTPSPRPSATPSGTPSPGPSTSERPGAPHTGVIPADFGTALADRALPPGEEAGTDELGPFGAQRLPIVCASSTEIDLPSLGGLEASRLRGRIEAGDASALDGVLLFRSEAEAVAFMAELQQKIGACAPVGEPGPNIGTPEDPIIERTLMASSTEPGLVADTFTVRYWTERELDGTWHEAPGGTLDLWGRSGRLVAIHSTSGEYVGDPHEEAAADLPPAQVLADLLAMA